MRSVSFCSCAASIELRRVSPFIFPPNASSNTKGGLNRIQSTHPSDTPVAALSLSNCPALSENGLHGIALPSPTSQTILPALGSLRRAPFWPFQDTFGCTHTSHLQWQT